MGIIAWIVLGLVAGFIASKIMGTSGQQGILMDIVLGIVGAVVGGILVSAITGVGITGLNLWSVLVAILGACVVIWLYHRLNANRTL